MKRTLLAICIVALAVTNLLSQQNSFPKLTGPCLGQKSPVNMTELVRAGVQIVSSELNTRDIAFIPDGDKIAFSSFRDGLQRNLHDECRRFRREKIDAGEQSSDQSGLETKDKTNTYKSLKNREQREMK